MLHKYDSYMYKPVIIFSYLCVHLGIHTEGDLGGNLRAGRVLNGTQRVT